MHTAIGSIAVGITIGGVDSLSPQDLSSEVEREQHKWADAGAVAFDDRVVAPGLPRACAEGKGLNAQVAPYVRAAITPHDSTKKRVLTGAFAWSGDR